MKKVFPLIIILITLSVLGIIFIQMSWIHNSVELRKQQREQDLLHAITQIKQSLYDIYLFNTGRIGFINEDSKNYYLTNFTVEIISPEEITSKIDTALKRYNIREPFEYSITNIFQTDIVKTKGFTPEMKENAIEVELTLKDPSAHYYEVLHLYIKEENNFLIRKIGWYIAGSILFTIIIISAFYLTVRTMFRQKKLS
ncbi:MAG: hypothetical protein K8F30_07340, partial [Taibaiella sp.]|nr:hypothetical protein [Taibaiella sp.]